MVTMRHPHRITQAILRRHPLHNSTATALVLLHKEVLLSIPLSAQTLLSSWFHQLASSVHSNKHRNPDRLRILTRYLKGECLSVVDLRVMRLRN
jgi:hypothetical protein